MNAFTPLKSALVSSIFALSAFANPASASKEIRENPTCTFDFMIARIMERSFFSLIDIKASSPEWNMEIYTNPQTSEWSLIGQSKDPQADPSDRCQLAWGNRDTPYTQTTWYKQYFQKPSVAADETRPQPRVN